MLRAGNQGAQQKKGLEEEYERLYPKIGRDFVSREDLQDVLDLLSMALGAISVLTGGIAIPKLTIDNAKAITKALLYKDIVETGKDGTKLFRDLVNIDED